MKIVGGPASRKKQVLKPKEQDVMDGSLADTSLALRTQNTLERHGILTIRHLSTKTVEELMDIPNLGQITIQALRAFMDELGVPHRLNADEVQVQTAKKRLEALKRKLAQKEPSEH